MKLASRSLPFLIAGAGFAICVIAYWPGILEPDSLDQLEQARSGRFGDWHPPIVALVWRMLNAIHYGPQLPFLMHLGLLWSGLALIGRTFVLLGRRFGALLPLVGLAPWVTPLLGVLISDTALASSWMFACAALFYQSAPGAPRSRVLLGVAGAAFIYGALARANTILAAAPLLLYALFEWTPKRARLNIIIAALSPFVLLGLAGVVNHSVATSDYPLGSLQTFDLGGISHFSGRNLMPGTWSSAESRQIIACYDPNQWDVYEEAPCASAASKLDAQDLWTAPILTQHWLRAIAQHPIAYVEHRLDYANHFFRWLGGQPHGWLDYDTEDTAPAAFTHHSNALYQFYSGLAETDYIALRPYFWLALSFAVLLLAALAQASPAQRFGLAMSASAILYLGFYFVVGVACDFRYALWAIFAAMAASASLCACTWQAQRWPGAAAAAAALLIAAIGVSAWSGTAI